MWLAKRVQRTRSRFWCRNWWAKRRKIDVVEWYWMSTWMKRWIASNVNQKKRNAMYVEYSTMKVRTNAWVHCRSTRSWTFCTKIEKMKLKMRVESRTKIAIRMKRRLWMRRRRSLKNNSDKESKFEFDIRSKLSWKIRRWKSCSDNCDDDRIDASYVSLKRETISMSWWRVRWAAVK